MDDTIEVCSGCGKMPRPIDSAGGSFICSRCSGRSTMFVTANDYEKIVTELDQRFHQTLQNKKMEEVTKTPIKFGKKSGKVSKKAKKQEKQTKKTKLSNKNLGKRSTKKLPKKKKR